MKVKLFRGMAKPRYTLYLAADAVIASLSSEAQEAIAAVGELEQIGEVNLAERSIPFHDEIMRRVRADGAYFVKTTVEISEIVIRPGGHGA